MTEDRLEATRPPLPNADDRIPGLNVTVGEVDRACAFLVSQGWAGLLSFDEAVAALVDKDEDAADAAVIEERDAAKKALRRHGDHHRSCAKRAYPSSNLQDPDYTACTCGWDELIAPIVEEALAAHRASRLTSRLD